MSERAREPLDFEEAEEGAEPQPETSSAGGVRPPGRIGSGLRDDSGGSEPEGGSGRLGEGIPLTRRQYSTPLETLHLSMPTYARLRRMGTTSVGEVLKRTDDELLALGNLSLARYRELREKLAVWLSLLDTDLTPD